MTRMSTVALFLLAAAMMSGCSNYNFSRAVYDAVQTREQLQSTPAERAGKPEPLNYQQYDSERSRQ